MLVSSLKLNYMVGLPRVMLSLPVRFRLEAKHPGFKSLAMFWAESRVGKRFRASNMLIHCNEVQCLDSPVFVHGDLLWLPCWSNLAKQCSFGTESCLGSSQGWEIGVLAAALIWWLWKYCCTTFTQKYCCTTRTEVAVHYMAAELHGAVNVYLQKRHSGQCCDF